MRIINKIMFSAVALLCSGSLQAAPLKVIVCAGQSNMVGKKAVLNDFPQALKTPVEGNLFFDGKRWIPLEIGKTERKGGCGPEVSLAKRLSEKLGEPIGIIKKSCGGTNLHQKWAPNGILYPGLVKKVKEAQKVKDIEIIGMAWMQGCADSNDPVMATSYSTNLAQLINNSRKDFGGEDMVFVAGRVNPPKPQYVNLVRAAIETCPLPNYGFINCDKLPKGDDKVHYSAAGYAQMGYDFADTLANLLGSNK